MWEEMLKPLKNKISYSKNLYLSKKFKTQKHVFHRINQYTDKTQWPLLYIKVFSRDVWCHRMMSTTTVSKLWSACVCEIYERRYSLLSCSSSAILCFNNRNIWLHNFFQTFTSRKILHLLQNKIVYSNPEIMDNTLALCLTSIRRVGIYIYATRTVKR